MDSELWQNGWLKSEMHDDLDLQNAQIMDPSCLCSLVGDIGPVFWALWRSKYGRARIPSTMRGLFIQLAPANSVNPAKRIPSTSPPASFNHADSVHPEMRIHSASPPSTPRTQIRSTATHTQIRYTRILLLNYIKILTKYIKLS